MNFPLVKIISLDNMYYLYDGRANTLLCVSSEEKDSILEYIHKYPDGDRKAIINHLQSKGILLPGGLEKKINLRPEYRSSFLEYVNNFAIPQRLTIEITDRCNLRCKYCLYTINENKHIGKHHGFRIISEEYAYKAIDLYYGRYMNVCKKINLYKIKDFVKSNPPTIGFYGGEALLEFELIKKLVCYINSQEWNIFNIQKNNIKYSITTNLTLLTDDILKYCVENNIDLHVSLDGPKEEHDKNRVFINGKGTFDTVYNNLLKIKKLFPHYYLNNIKILAVMAPNYNTANVDNFFKSMSSNNYYGGVKSVIYSQCKESDSIISSYYLDNDSAIKDNIDLGNYENSKDLKIKICMSPTFSSLLRSVHNIMSILDEVPLREPVNYITSCYIGFNKLFVSAKGEYHMCERSDFSFPLGTVNTGFDLNALDSCLEKFFKISNSDRCKACWAFRFCKCCPAQFAYKSNFKLPKESECDYMRNEILQEMIYMIIIQNKYPRIREYIVNNMIYTGEKSIENYL